MTKKNRTKNYSVEVVSNLYAGTTGYGEAGASYKKKAFKSFNAKSSSPNSDINYNLNALRNRSRMLYMSGGIGTAAIKTTVSNVVGVGLTPNPCIDFDFLGMSKDNAKQWQQRALRLWDLWANNKRNCDSRGMCNFYQLEEIALLGALMNGDSFALIKRADIKPMQPLSLRLDVIEADLVSTPKDLRSSNNLTDGLNKDNNNKIYNGVEVDDNGLIEAYHICNQYPLLASASTVDVAFTKLKPSGVTASDIIGGYNALTAEASGIECIEKVFPMLGKVPSCLLAPGFSKNPTVMSALKAKAADINSVFKAIFICDADCSTVRTYDAVGTWKNTNSYTDKQMLLTWPAVKIGTDIFHSSIQLGARYASLVASQIDGFPCDYPSNVDAGIQGACLADGTEVNLDIKQANTLNEQGVCTFLNWQGWKNWGVYTAAYPGNRDVKDYFSAIRTIFTNWNNTFVLTHFNKIDKCMSRKRIDNILDTENIRVSAFTQNDLIADAHMEFEETQNPATNLLAGKITFHQFLSCYPPMNEIENILEFDVEGLQNRLFGGN